MIFVVDNGEGPEADGPRNRPGAVRAQQHGLYGASPAASMAPNPTMKTKKVLMSIVDPFGVSRKSIHSR